jgi:hypothetical protein
MTVKKAILPAHDVPLVGTGGRMNPDWYEFFTNLLKRGVLDMPDVDNSTAITNTQVLVWNSAASKFKPGAN